MTLLCLNAGFESGGETQPLQYEPPRWAQTWQEPQIVPPATSQVVQALDEDTAPQPVLFRFHNDRQTTDEIWTGRISVAVVGLGLLWFGGHIIATVAGGL